MLKKLRIVCALVFALAALLLGFLQARSALHPDPEQELREIVAADVTVACVYRYEGVTTAETTLTEVTRCGSAYRIEGNVLLRDEQGRECACSLRALYTRKGINFVQDYLSIACPEE